MKIEIGRKTQTIIAILIMIGVVSALSEYGNNINIPGNFTGMNGIFSGDISVNDITVSGTVDGVDVSTIPGTYVAKSGDTMTGNLIMGNDAAGRGVYWADGANPSHLQTTSTLVLRAGTNQNGILAIQDSNSNEILRTSPTAITASKPIIGNITSTGNITAKNIGGVVYADQYSSIQAAINACPSSGYCTIKIPGNSTPYKTTNLTMRSFTTIEGDGAEATILQPTADDYMFYFPPATYQVNIRNLAIIDTDSNTSTHPAIFFNNVGGAQTFIKISDILVRNYAGVMWSATAADTISYALDVQNFNADQTRGDGFKFYRITDSWFYHILIHYTNTTGGQSATAYYLDPNSKGSHFTAVGSAGTGTSPKHGYVIESGEFYSTDIGVDVSGNDGIRLNTGSTFILNGANIALSGQTGTGVGINVTGTSNTYLNMINFGSIPNDDCLKIVSNTDYIYLSNIKASNCGKNGINFTSAIRIMGTNIQARDNSQLVAGYNGINLTDSSNIYLDVITGGGSQRVGISEMGTSNGNRFTGRSTDNSVANAQYVGSTTYFDMQGVRQDYGNHASAPAGSRVGETYYDTDVNYYCYYNSTAWVDVSTGLVTCS